MIQSFGRREIENAAVTAGEERSENIVLASGGAGGVEASAASL